MGIGEIGKENQREKQMGTNRKRRRRMVRGRKEKREEKGTDGDGVKWSGVGGGGVGRDVGRFELKVVPWRLKKPGVWMKTTGKNTA